MLWYRKYRSKIWYGFNDIQLNIDVLISTVSKYDFDVDSNIHTPIYTCTSMSNNALMIASLWSDNLFSHDIHRFYDEFESNIVSGIDDFNTFSYPISGFLFRAWLLATRNITFPRICHVFSFFVLTESTFGYVARIGGREYNVLNQPFFIR